MDNIDVTKLVKRKELVKLSLPSSGRALFLLPTDLMGGAERVVTSLCKTAAEEKLFKQIDLIVLSKEPTGSLDFLRYLTNIEIIYLKAARELFGVPQLILKNLGQSYDLVISSHTHLNAYSSFARKLGILRTKKLVTRESTSIFELNIGRHTFFVRFLNKFYGSQDLIICQTDRMAESYNRNTKFKFSDRLVIIPNPIDLRRIANGKLQKFAHASLREGALKIAWCGRLIDIKNPLLAIDVANELKPQLGSDFQLLMIGDGELRQPLEQRIQKFGLQENVVLCGQMSNPIAAMAQCELGLLTSHLEGFPNVLLEMLGAGVKRIITTDCAGGLADLPGTTVSQDGSAQSLVSAILDSVSLARPDGVDHFLHNRDLRQFLFTACQA